MSFKKLLTTVSLLLGAVVAQQKPLVSSKALQADVDINQLVAGEDRLQAFANRYYQKNRVFGGQAHNDSVTYIYNQLVATGYYDVSLQPQRHLWSDSNVTLTVTGKDYPAEEATYGPNGNVTAGIVKVAALGCVQKNFPAAVKGKIALIERGTCDFAVKVARAGKAGAAGAIIYNNEPGSIAGTLGSATNPIGPYVPIVFATQAAGRNFVMRLNNGTLRGNLFVNAVQERRLTYNVIATTKTGDKNNVVALGGHTDSVNEGPGINDDGSGSIGILHIAKNLVKYRVTNAVRFCFWTAEEFGLLGSTFYVNNLSKAELNKIRLFLDFDMIASPNYIYTIYDGDGSRFNMTGPPGSAQIERLFEKFYDDNNTPHIAVAFDGRSDYQAFIENGVPAGGIFTGAEEIKTPRQAQRFGGTAGKQYDPCYHQACDTNRNLALGPFELNTRAISHAVATYATNLNTIPKTRKTKRTVNDPSTLVKRAEPTIDTDEEDGVRMPCNRYLCPVYK